MGHHIKNRLAIIGAGRITSAHIEAALEAGFDIAAICARPHSKNATRLAAKYGIEYSAASLEELLNHNFDAYSITVSTDAQIEVLSKILPFNKPCLIEKPISIYGNKIQNVLDHFNTKKLIVGLNRRHYEAVLTFKDFVMNCNESLSFSVTIPEYSWDLDPNPNRAKNYFVDNSVHVIDLVNFIFGKIEFIETIKSPNYELSNIAAIVSTEKNFVGSINVSFSASANTAIEAFTKGKYIQLKPMEKLSIYEGMVTKPANFEAAYKTYTPVLTQFVEPKIQTNAIKPGFLGQYSDLLRICHSERDVISATILDTLEAVNICRKIVD